MSRLNDAGDLEAVTPPLAVPPTTGHNDQSMLGLRSGTPTWVPQPTMPTVTHPVEVVYNTDSGIGSTGYTQTFNLDRNWKMYKLHSVQRNSTLVFQSTDCEWELNKNKHDGSGSYVHVGKNSDYKSLLTGNQSYLTGVYAVEFTFMPHSISHWVGMFTGMFTAGGGDNYYGAPGDYWNFTGRIIFGSNSFKLSNYNGESTSGHRTQTLWRMK